MKLNRFYIYVLLSIFSVTSLVAQTVSPAAETNAEPAVAEPSVADAPADEGEEAVVKKPAKETRMERMILVLRFGNSRQVRDALGGIKKLTPEEQQQLAPYIRDLISSNDVLVQRKVAETIGKLPYSDLDGEIPALLKSKSDSVFFAALQSAEKKKIQEAMPVLEEELKAADFTKNSNRIPDSIRIFGSMEYLPVKPFLVEKMKDETTFYEFRTAIFVYLATIGNLEPELLTYIRERAFDEKESISIRAYAAYALGKVEDTGSIEGLREILKEIDAIENPDEKSKYTRLRIHAMKALVIMKDDNVKKDLISMARDDDVLARIRAIRLMADIDDPEIRELLEFKAKHDTSIKVQQEAKKALEKPEEEEEESDSPVETAPE